MHIDLIPIVNPQGIDTTLSMYPPILDRVRVYKSN